MITDEERQSIINEAVEKALLMLPEVVGNLIMNQAHLVRVNRQFYEKYPDFAKNKDVVASVVERLEGDNPGINYTELLDKAAPVIREQIRTMKGLNTTSITKPNRNLASVNFTKSDHGEL